MQLTIVTFSGWSLLRFEDVFCVLCVLCYDVLCYDVRCATRDTDTGKRNAEQRWGWAWRWPAAQQPTPDPTPILFEMRFDEDGHPGVDAIQHNNNLWKRTLTAVPVGAVAAERRRQRFMDAAAASTATTTSIPNMDDGAAVCLCFLYLSVRVCV